MRAEGNLGAERGKHFEGGFREKQREKKKSENKGVSEGRVLLLGCVSIALGHQSVCVPCRCPVLSNLIYLPVLLLYLQYVRLLTAGLIVAA